MNGLHINKKPNVIIDLKDNNKQKDSSEHDNRMTKHKSHDVYETTNPKRNCYSTKLRNTVKEKTNDTIKRLSKFPYNSKCSQLKKQPLITNTNDDENKLKEEEEEVTIIKKKNQLELMSKKVSNKKSNQLTIKGNKRKKSLDRIMSDGSFQEVDSYSSDDDDDDDASLSKDVGEREIDIDADCIVDDDDIIENIDINSELYLGSINEEAKVNITGLINRFPKLSVNPFMNPNERITSSTDNKSKLVVNKPPKTTTNAHSIPNAGVQPITTYIKSTTIPTSIKTSSTINTSGIDSNAFITNTIITPTAATTTITTTAAAKYKGKVKENMTVEMKYRKLLSLAKKGDREAFIETLEQILKNKGDINYKDENGWTALHYACEEGNLKIVEIILKANGDVNVKSQNKRTSLHITSSHGYFDISKLLVENGALINSADNEKNTPLHLCSASGHIELLKFFLDKNPQVDIKNIYGKTPLMIATKADIKELIREYLSKKDNNYHKVKIHLTTEKTMNTLINSQKQPIQQREFSTPLTEGNQFAIIDLVDYPNSANKNIDKISNTNRYINSQNNNNNISTNLNRDRIEQNNKGINSTFTKKTQIKKQQVTINLNSEANQPTPSNRIIVPRMNKQVTSTYSLPKKNSISNFSISSSIQRQSTITSGSKLPKTKTLTKFTHYKQHKENGMTKEEMELNHTTNKNIHIQHFIDQSAINDSITIKNNMNISNDRLNKTEEILYNKASQMELLSNEENNQNLYSQINLNSIEEERVTPSSFMCHALIGEGSFGKVYLVEKINSKLQYAMKVLDKDRILGQNLIKYAMAERNVLSLTNHPFIVKLNYAFQTTNQLFLLMDYCSGGDLSKHLFFEKEHRFTEDRAKFYICEILLALEDLHKKDIIFRDLKPDNVVLDSDGHAILTDFGLSKEEIFDSKGAKSFCGSIAYLAPEMLKKQGHGKAVDWYLLGVLFYEMLVGFPPHITEQKEDIFHNIEFGELKIPKQIVSKEAEGILRALLKRDPNQRLGGGERDAEEIKEHKYFSKVNWKDVYDKKIPPPKAKKLNKPLKAYNRPRMFHDDDDNNNEDKDDIIQNSSNTRFNKWTFINDEDI